MGKPEPLKGNLSGCWSRRINEEHRLVYMVKEDCIYILQCRFHY
nr:Txe/YoeB family addiction module toxin [Sediminibacterium sp. C3]